MKTKYFFCGTKAIDAEKRTIEVVASTADYDRDNEVVLPSAFEKGMAAFRSNPVILACHQHRLQTGSSPVIGSAVPETIRISDKDLSFTMRFADTPLGNEYWSLYRDRHMSAFSIGFIPIAWEDFQDGSVRGRRFTAVELLEVSAVPVPANPYALARAMSYQDEIADPTEAVKSIQAPILSAIAEIQKILGGLAPLCEEVNSLADDLGEIKILIAGPGGLGRELLGGSPDADPLAGKQADAEAVHHRISKILQS